jgi:hypothetical protein
VIYVYKGMKIEFTNGKVMDPDFNDTPWSPTEPIPTHHPQN